ncbi:MAG: tyrosine-type recombinase/integrase [Sedimentisphaerales bacterium]
MRTITAYQCFLLHLYRFSPSTQSAYRGAIQRFADSAPRYIDQISAEHIERFLMSERKTRIASTCNLYLAAIKSWFNWMEETYNIPNPAKRIKRLKTLPPRRRNLTSEEFNRIIKSTTGYMRDIIQFMAMVGIRASEMLSLREENVRGNFLVFIGKGSKQCSTPLNSIAQNILKTNPTLLNLTKNRNRKWLFRLCRRASKIAGLETPISPHDLRHFYANQLHRSCNGEPGLSIEIISKLMNHSTPAVTASVYIEWLNDDLIGKTEKLTKLSK